MDQAVAVIGMSCHLPRADDPEEFWRLLSTGSSLQRWPDDPVRSVPSPFQHGPSGTFLRIWVR
jgi:acyl transferase domain-containing protein